MKMKMTTKLFFSLVIGSLAFGLVPAGTLDPPGPPAPTMVTLQQIYDKLGALTGDVPKTGQTGCSDASGIVIGCAGTGQDGEYQRGASASPRFTDNGNGTVKDNLTGLIWLKNANCFGLQTWTQALSDANTLQSPNETCGLTDGSAAGAWRLPNVRELQSLIDFGQFHPALPVGHPFAGVQSDFYWSSTSAAHYPLGAWIVYLTYGYAFLNTKDRAYYVWPVRDGQ